MSPEEMNPEESVQAVARMVQRAIALMTPAVTLVGEENAEELHKAMVEITSQEESAEPLILGLVALCHHVLLIAAEALDVTAPELLRRIAEDTARQAG